MFASVCVVFFCTVLSSLLLFLSSSWLVLVLARRALESDLSVGAGDEDAVYTYTHIHTVGGSGDEKTRPEFTRECTR